MKNQAGANFPKFSQVGPALCLRNLSSHFNLRSSAATFQALVQHSSLKFHQKLDQSINSADREIRLSYKCTVTQTASKVSSLPCNNETAQSSKRVKLLYENFSIQRL